MNTAEILALCREAQANPDYVADYPEIAMRLITEALPQVCRALELACQLLAEERLTNCTGILLQIAKENMTQGLLSQAKEAAHV